MPHSFGDWDGDFKKATGFQAGRRKPVTKIEQQLSQEIAASGFILHVPGSPCPYTIEHDGEEFFVFFEHYTSVFSWLEWLPDTQNIEIFVAIRDSVLDTAKTLGKPVAGIIAFPEGDNLHTRKMYVC